MRRAIGSTVIVAALVGALGLPPARAEAIDLVQVRNNYFSPREIRIEPGGTVTWFARDADHSITADDKRFDMPQPPRALRMAEVVSWTFPSEETVAYRCRIHPEMRGSVVVGRGSPPPPPPTPSVRIVPSTTYATVAHAIADAPPGTVIEVLPGVYHDTVEIARPGITVRGSGASPGDVVFEGGNRRPTGIAVVADDVHIANLTVRNFVMHGIAIYESRRFSVSDIHAVRNGDFGVYALRAQSGIIRSSSTWGSSKAGIAVEDVAEGPVDIERVVARESGAGLRMTGARGVTVRSSTFERNGAGIVVKGTVSMEGVEQGGVRIHDNTLVDNDVDISPLDDRVGAGIWLSSATDAAVERNVVGGHRYGIVVTAIGAPSSDQRIRDNTVVDSRFADLGWDGIGADVCFEGNAGGGDEPTSDPPNVQLLYSCGIPVTVGIPWPVVTARLLTG